MIDHESSKRWIIVWATAAILLWSLLAGFSLYWNVTNLREQKIMLASDEARASWNKDMAFRSWASRHGGVYVRQDERTPPNPYMAHLSKRDVTLDDGTRLTLMNPAYMMSQMTEEYEAVYGTKGKATGKVVLNPANRPDEWELQALRRFDLGEEEVLEQVAMEGAPYLRFMRRVMMEKSCLPCHGHLGFREGDVRGGVSISIPLAPYFEAEKDTVQSFAITHVVVWILGIYGVVMFASMICRRQEETRKLLRKIEHEALHDVLTGLANRKVLLERMVHCLARVHREEGYLFSVCFVDLDRFKLINDSYGHRLGDELLKVVARILEQCIKPTDMVARLGGDEFILLLESTSSLEETLVVAEQVLESLREVIVVDGVSIHTDASIGICSANSSYLRAEDMIRDADNAMYRAKDEGRGRIEFFDAEMHRRAVSIMRMESELHYALERNELEVFYQPVVNTHSKRVGGFEALLRWHHPEMGSIQPAEFIAVAENTGLIGRIGDWVLQQACAQVHEWNQRYEQRFFVSVNISGKQLANHDIVESVEHVLRDSGLAPGLLHCEVTETALVQHKESAAEVLNAIQGLGVHISIDDFGTGYSSLTYLHQFSFDILKIDKSFVQDMTAKGRGLQLVRMLMMLAQDFNMEVIAEGVETEEQLSRLEGFQCTWVQGFYFMRPVPKEVVEAVIEEGDTNLSDNLPEWEPVTRAVLHG